MTDRAGQSKGNPPLPPPSIGGESVELRKELEAEQAAGVDGPRPLPSTEPAKDVLVGSSEPLAVSVADLGSVSGAGIPSGRGKTRIGDRIFAGMSIGASGFVILIVVLVAVFLIAKSVPSIADDKINFLTSSEFDTTNADNLRFGIAGLLYVTVAMSIIAMIIAVPIGVGIALFITQYAPRSIAKPVAFVIDLLAAIPSIVYGIWGYTTLSKHLTPVQDFLSHIPLPIFNNTYPTGTIFNAGVVLAVMVLPIVTAISRDVFERTPRANVEAALALGATKWEMIRMAVLPYGRPGVVSGSMLGLGRALGETIAVLLILSTVSGGLTSSIFTGGSTFASKIALNASEFNNPKTTGAYIAAGLVLFILTFVVNAAARAIVNRRKDFT